MLILLYGALSTPYGSGQVKKDETRQGVDMARLAWISLDPLRVAILGFLGREAGLKPPAPLPWFGCNTGRYRLGRRGLDEEAEEVN